MGFLMPAVLADLICEQNKSDILLKLNLQLLAIYNTNDSCTETFWVIMNRFFIDAMIVMEVFHINF